MSESNRGQYSNLFGGVAKLVVHLQLTLVLFALVSCTPSFTPQVAEHFLNTDPEPVEIKKPTIQRWKLANGLQVLFLPDDELPIASGAVVMPGGTFWESAHKPGVVSTMGGMMRNGGTKSTPPAALNEELRRLSAGISSSYGGESGKVSFSCLSGDVDQVFSHFADVVRSPYFDQERLEVAKIGVLDGIRRRKESIEDVASISGRIVLYRNNSRGRVLTSSDVKNIDREMLFKAHEEFVKPDGAYLVVTGDLSREKVEQLANDYFGTWEPRGSSLGEPDSLLEPYPPGIYFVEGDFTQSQIYAVDVGPSRFAPDLFSINLLNSILGDGLDSRINKTVRADLGLAYTVAAYVTRKFQRGANLIYIQTKSESTLKALQAAISEVERIQSEPPTEEELNLVKQAAQSGFVFKFDSPLKLLDRQVSLEMLKYPADFDSTYLDNTFAVSASDVAQSARKWWKLDEMRYVIVGSSSAYSALSEEVKSDPLLSTLPLYKLKFDELPIGKPIQ